MRQFFKYVFATIVGIKLFVIFSLVIVIGIVAIASKEKPPTIADKSVLKIDLNYDIPEHTTDNPFAGMSITNLKPRKALGLNDILASIEKAKTDDKIKGIYLEMGINENGFATLESIRNALIDFKEKGKFVYAYGQVVTQKSYYVSSVADKIYVNPSGGMELKGFGREIMYYKGMFDKLGIEVQDFHCGSFKSAIEPFLRTNMSDANRQQLLYIYGDVYNHFLTKIAEARKIDTADLNRIINNLEVESTAKAKELKVIDEEGFYDQVVDAMKEKLGLEKKKDITFVEIAKYSKTIESKTDGDKVAVVYAEGEIKDGEGNEDEIGGDRFAKVFRKLRNDEKVKAVVLRINSPGGSALASDVMWRELILLKKEKPLVISFGDVAASGGYFIACIGDRIFAQPNSITGSIGVFGLLPNAKKMFNEKLGITFDEVEVTKHGVLGGITKPLDELESKIVQRNVERTYAEFKQHVAEGRGKDTAYIETIAQGRVWTGNQGLKNGLVDELGTLNDAIAFAVKKADLKKYYLQSYPREKSLQEQIAESFDEAKIRSIKEEIGEEQYQVYKTLKSLKEMRGTQMRMVYNLGL
jgi:protease-4